MEVQESKGKRTIYGYGAVFDKPSQVLEARGVGEFIEYVDRRAFDEVINDPMIMILANHDANYVLGRNTITARMGVDSVGLFYEVQPPDSRRDILESIERGDIFGSSFSFDVEREEWANGDDRPVRSLTKFKRLYDTGPVAFPAYPDTTSAARSLQGFLDRAEEERWQGNNLYKYRIKMIENSIII